MTAVLSLFVVFTSCTIGLLACSVTAPVASTPEVPDYYDPQADIRYEDRSYSPTIRTVQLYKTGFELSVPVIQLGSGETMELHFDDLSPDPENLNWTIVHCDPEWKPSDLSQGQYLDGAFSDFIPPPIQSFNTRQPFLHYAVEVPNFLIKPRISGNYILKVFRNGDETDLVLTRRFLVFETKVQIAAQVLASRDVERRNTAQQVDLTLRHPELQVPDPFGDLTVTVLQNMRWDDARTGARPKFVRGNELVYDFPPETLFDGGNEWRPLNAKSTRFNAPSIANIKTDAELVEFFMVPDIKRNIRVYLDQPDLNGRYLTKTDDGYDAALESDYVHVYWQLPMSQQLPGDVFVYGAFSDFQCWNEYRMAYDAPNQRYYLRGMVKQGFIDYQYAYLAPGSTVPDLTAIEGTHFATENDYCVLVYFNDWNVRAHRLVGVHFLNNRRQ
ncbi:MAG: DUF5103 domain-containing protein [Flavobacteriales bacterium]|nr:DUF5103 domain-containing protein [Flavobacteriales bacterium]